MRLYVGRWSKTRNEKGIPFPNGPSLIRDAGPQGVPEHRKLRRFRCEECGSNQAVVTPDWREYNARHGPNVRVRAAEG